MRILTNMERIAQEFRVEPRFACTEATSLDKNNVSGITVRPDSTYAKTLMALWLARLLPGSTHSVNPSSINASQTLYPQGPRRQETE